MKYKILIVDDETANLRMLERLFRTDYDVITAETGIDGLELLSRHDVALIISDQRMPGMSGIEFLKKAAEMRQQTVRIILTGYTDVGDLVEAINSGVVYKYITKPWVNADLGQNVRRAIEHYHVTKNRHLLKQENERLVERLERTVRGTVSALRNVITPRQPEHADHARRTAEFAVRIGEQLDLGPRELENLIHAAYLHDIPHLRLPFEINFKKQVLTSDQFRLLKSSYEAGLRTIAAIPDLEDVVNTIRYQHEHFDGSGFFDALDGDKIPLHSRIIALANAIAEILSGRNSEHFCTDEEAPEWLRDLAGTMFDPTLVDICLEIGMVGLQGLPAASPAVNGHKGISAKGIGQL